MKVNVSKLRNMCRVAVSILPLLVVSALLPLSAQISGDQFDSWRFWGGNISNTHSNPFEHTLTTKNVSQLAPKWTFATGGDVSATPTVDSTSVYVPDWAGNLFKIDRRTGDAVWSHKISEYTGISGSLSRNSPAIVGNLLIFGDQASATEMAVDKNSGKLVWKTLLDSHAGAIITSSAVEFGGKIYVGVSSNQEGLAGSDPKFVLSFIGSVASLDAQTGHIEWQTFMAPEGYTGNAVWGSNFSIDPKRHSLYIATGNNYSVPQSVSDCLLKAKTVTEQVQCLDPKDYIETVLSLDLNTGKVKWAHNLGGADTFIISCLMNNSGGVPCPDPAGPDFDFGSAPNLLTVSTNGTERDMVGAGQKSGVYWALDPDTGATIWATLVGPGGVTGGIEWGSATDGSKIYVAINNSSNISYKLAPAHTVTVNAGSWAALDPATGNIIWQIPATGQNPLNPKLGAGALGQMSAAAGVVYAGSLSGDMVAIDGNTGDILWKFASGGSVICGPSIVDGTVFWGSGYSHIGAGTGNNKLFAFSLGKGSVGKHNGGAQ
jgi:polyvinyl alcohol dehydrogenase (cytochrome)